MTIYIVGWDNGLEYEDHDRGNLFAFKSREDADKYIEREQAEHDKKKTRLDELNKIFIAGTMTDDERCEFDELHNYFIYELDYPGYYWREDMELKE
jgi:hypothetical protein